MSAFNIRTCLLLLLIPFSPALAQDDPNPPAEGFNMEASSPRAIEVADQVMDAMGGRAAWDNTRYLSWSFFGEDQVWDKWTGRYRWQNDSIVVLMNLHDMTGRAYVNNTEAEPADDYLSSAYGDWINSGYWLLMPYKLKDSGVTLEFAGEGTTESGKETYILTLTFENVGRTPQNKYDVYVDKESMLVRQWSFYRNASDEAPAWTRPWDNWQPYGNIMLSDNRGPLGNGDPFILPNLGVYEDLPDAVFEDMARLDLASLKP